VGSRQDGGSLVARILSVFAGWRGRSPVKPAAEPLYLNGAMAIKQH
jgi:hypothetical protein